MRIKVTYFIKHEEELEMTPKEYCLFRANCLYNAHNIEVPRLPRGACDIKWNWDSESEKELRDFLDPNFDWGD